MIAFLHGVIEEKHPAALDLNVNGVGYAVSISLNTFEDLPPSGDTTRLYTHHYVREDSEQLYGFSSKAERAFFSQLIGVSGIGPTLAISILSSLPIAAFCSAISNADVKRLSTIKGIGKKTAERIIVELKDKVSAFAFSSQDRDSSAVSPETAVLNDAVLALVALGFKNSEAFAAVKAVIVNASAPLSVEEVVRKTLSSLQS